MRLLIVASALLLLLVMGTSPADAQQHHEHGSGHRHQADALSAEVHPEPRPGVTAARVLPVKWYWRGKTREAYEAARTIPEVFDGLHCHCDCEDRDGLRSLLSCFENDMASSCGYCQSEARLVLQLHQEGKTLDEIRAAVDERYAQ